MPLTQVGNIICVIWTYISLEILTKSFGECVPYSIDYFSASNPNLRRKINIDRVSQNRSFVPNSTYSFKKSSQNHLMFSIFRISK